MSEKSIEVVLKELYPKIDVIKILNYYNLNYKPQGDELLIKCFFHEKYRNKIDKNPSLSININKKVYKCWSCPAKGNMYQLVMQLEINRGKKSCSFFDAVKKICEILNIEFEGVFKLDKNKMNEDLSIDDITYLNEHKIVEIFNDSVLKKFYLKKHNYFLDRGYKQETLDYFEMGFGTKGKDVDRCIFPVRNIYGGLVGWTGRAVKSSMEPKWLHRPKERFFTSLNLFNIDKALPYIIKTKEVNIVESVGNCMRMFEAGKRNTVAILGNKISEYQIELLLKYVNTINLLLDNDEGGISGIEIAINYLIDKDVIVNIGDYNFGYDDKGYAFDIGAVNIDRILNEINYIPMLEYMRMNRGVLKMLDGDINLENPIRIETDNGSVILINEIDKENKEIPQLCLDDILYIRRLNNLFNIRGLEVSPPF